MDRAGWRPACCSCHCPRRRTWGRPEEKEIVRAREMLHPSDRSRDDISNPVIQDPFCSQHPQFCIGGALDSNYYSKTGAYNGSGIALAGESWNKGQRRLFTLFFQHHAGDIRYMTYGVDQKWEGGNSSNVIATDAKGGSPISAVAYLLGNVAHVSCDLHPIPSPLNIIDH